MLGKGRGQPGAAQQWTGTLHPRTGTGTTALRPFQCSPDPVSGSQQCSSTTPQPWVRLLLLQICFRSQGALPSPPVPPDRMLELCAQEIVSNPLSLLLEKEDFWGHGHMWPPEPKTLSSPFWKLVDTCSQLPSLRIFPLTVPSVPLEALPEHSLGSTHLPSKWLW